MTAEFRIPTVQMEHDNTSGQVMWTGLVEKTPFNVSVARPLCVISHRFPAKIKARFDMHYGLELGVMLTGNMRRYWQGHAITLGPGGIWVCGMWEPHGWAVTRAPCRAVVLIIEPSFLLRAGREISDNINWLAPFRTAPDNRPRLTRRLRVQAAQLARELVQPAAVGHPMDGNAHCRIKLLELILIIPPGHGRPEYHADEMLARVDQAVQLIFSSQKYISTQAAARHCAMSRNAFAQLFKKVMGLSFAEFALRYRVSSAARDMLAQASGIKHIAADWGFTDPSHFYRCFRKYHHCSPTAWMLHHTPAGSERRRLPVRNPS